MLIHPAAVFLRRRKAPQIGDILEIFQRVFCVNDADILYNTLIMAATQVLELDPNYQRVAAYLEQMKVLYNATKCEMPMGCVFCQ